MARDLHNNITGDSRVRWAPQHERYNEADRPEGAQRRRQPSSYTGNNRMRTRDLTNNYVTTLAGSSSGYQDGVGEPPQFSGPYGVVHHLSKVDGSIVLFVADYKNSRVRRITVASANVTSVAQTPVLEQLLVYFS